MHLAKVPNPYVPSGGRKYGIEKYFEEWNMLDLDALRNPNVNLGFQSEIHQFNKKPAKDQQHWNQQNQFSSAEENEPVVGHPAIILTHNGNYNNFGGRESRQDSLDSGVFSTEGHEDCDAHEHEYSCRSKVNANVGGGGGGQGHNSWNKILQCFSVFKPRKSTDLSPTTGPTHSTEFQEGGLKEPPASAVGIGNGNSNGLRRNMNDSDLYLQELADNSEIMERLDTKNLGKNLPARAIGYSWERIFSTTEDGFSLHTLYRKMEGIDSPILFVVEDIEGRVFGAMLSCGFKISENFYGGSDTFLMRFRPEFEVFKWSGDNFYFMQGQDSFISVGSDDGRFGLWLDDNLYMGRTEKCSTFSSPPLVPEKDFKVKTVECWTVSLV